MLGRPGLCSNAVVFELCIAASMHCLRRRQTSQEPFPPTEGRGVLGMTNRDASRILWCEELQRWAGELKPCEGCENNFVACTALGAVPASGERTRLPVKCGARCVFYQGWRTTCAMFSR